MKKHLNNVSHDYIRYANCWEDADVLLEALQVAPGDKVLSIGSGGDNSFSLLTGNPERVVAVDINAAQLNLIALKKAAFQALDYDSFLEFLGFKTCINRWELFLTLKVFLTTEQENYWTERRKLLEDGIIFKGKFEKYFLFFYKKILPLIHFSDRVEKLFQKKDRNQQDKFYKKKWHNWRWKLLFKLFFSKYVLGNFGRDPAFLNQVNVPVSDYLLDKTRKHLSSTNCQNNYFLKFILTGKFGGNLPHYAREENFYKIKSNIDKLDLFYGLAEDAFEKYGTFNKFNLSNIFEYMPKDVFGTVAKNLLDFSQPNSRFAYWNLMVYRKISEMIPGLQYQREYSETLTSKDKGFFYNQFIIETKL